MIDILNIVLPTFIVIFIGYLFGKRTKLDISSIVEIVFYIGFPSLAFTSMTEKTIILLDAAKIWSSALIIMFGCGAIAWIMFKMIGQKHSGLYISIFLMNSVNIPFPILYLVHGPEGLFAATLFYIPNSLLMYTLGIYVVSGKHWKDSLKEVAKVPALYAAVAGLLINFSQIAVPDLVARPLSLIGSMVIPLVLLVLGYNLSRVRLNSLPTTFLASFLRVGVGLLLGFLSVKLFALKGILRSVVILDSAMPAAANASILAAKYNNEAGLVSSVVLVTTIASMVVIPFLLYLLT
ncbi:AEC family transporter [Chloroflexota bacterium]